MATEAQPELINLHSIEPLEQEGIVVSNLATEETQDLPVQSILKLQWLLSGLALIALVARLLTMPSFIETRDGIFFVQALERYAVSEMRPHWPGYPVYIWLGKFFNLFIANPTQALHVLSVVASTLTLFPVAALATSWRKAGGANPSEAQRAGLVAALIWVLVPLSWLGGSEIFSDPLALLLGLTMLWLCWHYLNTHQARWLFLAAVLGGLMVGVRLSYLSLLLPLLYTAWLARKDKITVRKRRLPFILTFSTLAFLMTAIFLWLGWQYLVEGERFIQAGLYHLAGHYNEWGGSVTTDHNLLTRPLRFLETTLVHGLGGWWFEAPLVRLPVTLLLISLITVGGWQLLRSAKKLPLILALLWLVPYTLWIGLGNDVDLVRYTLPMVALLCMLAGIGVKQNSIFLTGTILALAIVTVPLALEHQANPPIGQQLTHYMQVNFDPKKNTIFIVSVHGVAKEEERS